MGSHKVSVVLILLLYSLEAVLSLELLADSLSSRLYPSQKYVTVSGEEIGGVMAQMMHISHSKHIKGCAVYSSTFYRCGQPNGDPTEYQFLCTKNSPLGPDEQYSVDLAVDDIQSYLTNQLIDDVKYIRNSYLYVYCGLQNGIYRADQQLNVIALYEHYLGSSYLVKARVQDTSDQLRVINTAERYQSACPNMPEPDGTLSKNCTNLSAPAEALGFLLDRYIAYINPFYPFSRYLHLEPLRSFNQTEFMVDLENTGLDEIGYYYVPRQCHGKQYSYGSKYGKPCLLHIFFHACGKGREFQGTTNVLSSNYLEIAELNNIIMLFPQALSSDVNPGGCWDYVGWSGPSYATKIGSQIEAIWRMIERLLYLPRENPNPYSTTSTPTYYRAKESTNSARAQESTNSASARAQETTASARTHESANVAGARAHEGTNSASARAQETTNSASARAKEVTNAAASTSTSSTTANANVNARVAGSSSYPSSPYSYSNNYAKRPASPSYNYGGGSGSSYRPRSIYVYDPSSQNKDMKQTTDYSYSKPDGKVKRCSKVTGSCENSPFIPSASSSLH